MRSILPTWFNSGLWLWGGEIVAAGRTKGFNIFGVEAFYKGGNSKEIAQKNGLLGQTVFELIDGSIIPFEDEHFDFVISNQVFEHVENIDHVLKEIIRILKPDGYFLVLFPAREVIREGHCGIPMAHWFPRDSRFRYPYMRIMRGLGLGYFKTGKTQAVWVRDFMNWLDQFTFYRPYSEIRSAFAKANLKVTHIEDDYIRFRLRRLGLNSLASILCVSPLQALARFACRRLGGMVILAKKN